MVATAGLGREAVDQIDDVVETATWPSADAAMKWAIGGHRSLPRIPKRPMHLRRRRGLSYRVGGTGSASSRTRGTAPTFPRPAACHGELAVGVGSKSAGGDGDSWPLANQPDAEYVQPCRAELATRCGEADGCDAERVEVGFGPPTRFRRCSAVGRSGGMRRLWEAT